MERVYLNGWTKESVIELVTREFKGKSIRCNNPKECRYRGEKSRKCIAGCFIPDDKYNTNMEGLRVEAIYTLLPYGTFPFNAHTMNCWQSKHDSLSPEDSVEQQLATLLKFLD